MQQCQDHVWDASNSILESMAVFDEISCVQASFSHIYRLAVNAETFTCTRMHAQESVSLLLKGDF